MNNFMNNSNNAYSYSFNIWHSPEPITYTYNGNIYTNYLGNYWDDYNGSDADNDGIGDTPYYIDENNDDSYPLMQPWENYVKSPQQYTLTTSVNPSNAGYVTLNPSGGIYDEGTVVTATVHAYDGYKFDYWSGDASGSNPTIQIIMNENKSIVAHYRDAVPPYTTHSLSPSLPNGNNGWYVSNVTITLNANDNTSGVNVTKYKIDDGNWKEYDKAFIISEEGEHTIKYYSIDNAGNEEDQNEINIKIDKTKASTTHSLSPSSPNDNNGWYIGNVTITLNANDNISGVNITKYKIDDGNWKKYTKPIKVINNGEHTIKYYSVDNAGNEEETKTFTIKIDKTKSTVSIKTPDNGLYIFGRKIFPSFSIIIIGKITIEVVANDSFSGVSYVEFYIDGVKKCNVSNEPYEYIWNERAFFKHTIKVIVYDMAGNTAQDEIEVKKFF